MSESKLQIYTIKEVSKILKTSRQQVRRMIRGGKLPAIKVGREWRIPEECLKVFLKDRAPTDNLAN